MVGRKNFCSYFWQKIRSWGNPGVLSGVDFDFRILKNHNPMNSGENSQCLIHNVSQNAQFSPESLGFRFF